MKLQCPDFCDIAIVADNALLAAQLSAAISQPGRYLAVMDGPRMGRPDASSEVIRRNNGLARVQPKAVVLAGLEPDCFSALAAKLPARLIRKVNSEADFPPLNGMKQVQCGAKQLGLGLLKALRQRQALEITETATDVEVQPSLSGHVVVCEAHEDLSEVIAANYAYALGASLHVIPKMENSLRESVLERFYSLQDDVGSAQGQILDDLLTVLRAGVGDLQIPSGGSLTFISNGVPYGFAFPEVPTTHLFTYPDLGLAIINGFYAERQQEQLKIAALIDPGTTEAPEINESARLLAETGAYVRVYRNQSANVRDVEQAVEYFPYDLLMFATHCGDAPGRRLTYEFRDSEGYDRVLVVDETLGIGRPDANDRLLVTAFYRFHSLDGVKWMDPAVWGSFHVGTAILDWERMRGEVLQPTQTEPLSRVKGSAALKMADHNYLPMPQNLANNRSPVIINNACVSWHELSLRFLFAGTRAYIGTLREVMTSEAHDVVLAFLTESKHTFLPDALWKAQNTTYNDPKRRSYIMTGVYTQGFHHNQDSVPEYLHKELTDALEAWQRRDHDDDASLGITRNVSEVIEYYRRELTVCDTLLNISKT